jgi:hypothetical protein
LPDPKAEQTPAFSPPLGAPLVQAGFFLRGFSPCFRLLRVHEYDAMDMLEYKEGLVNVILMG